MDFIALLPARKRNISRRYAKHMNDYEIFVAGNVCSFDNCITLLEDILYPLKRGISREQPEARANSHERP
jgi:hypothetical protein